MTSVNFPQANSRFGPPPGLADSQCNTIHAFSGKVQRGSVEGSQLVVVAWKPSEEEICAMLAGSPIYLSCIGGLPPHFLTTSFDEAINPA